jgi:long-chain acyl-CoA synthetase
VNDPSSRPTDAGLLAQARLRPAHPALVFEGRTTTYGELDDRARRYAHVLAAAGVRRGDRVAVMLENHPDWFAVVHGCGRLGAVVVPVNVHFKADEAGWVVDDSGAAVVVVDPHLEPAVAHTAPPRLTHDAAFEARLAAVPAGEVDDPGAIGDGWPTTMAYTSGTTGRPKGVAIAPDDFRRRAAGVAAGGATWGLGPGDVHLCCGPLYHAGPSYWAQMHLALGATVVLMRRWDAAEALRLIAEHRVTTAHMVPANFQRILALPEEVRADADVSSLRLVIHAAAPCPVPLKRAIMEFFGPETVWEYYGASEGGGTVISPQEWLEHPGSVGRPYPGTEFLILDDDGSPCPPGVPGTIWVRPAGSSFRYHNDPGKTAAAHRQGYFTVGDAGYLDEDGYLYLTDRKSDMVISGGVNIYPREIEDCLLAHPDVVDVAVLGLPDETWGEVCYAVVQPRPGAALREADVVAWVREHLADYKRPRVVEFVEELPRDPNGKVRKPRLREAWLARHRTA